MPVICPNSVNRRRFVLGASALACMSVARLHASAAPAKPSVSDDVLSLSAAYNGSGRQLFGDFAKKPGNIVFSPFSIGTAMAMVLSGARGATEAELANVLMQRLSRSEIEAASGKAMAMLAAYDTSSDPDYCEKGFHWTGDRCEGPPVNGRCGFARPDGGQCVSQPMKASTRLLIANALMLGARGGQLISPDYRQLLSERYAAEIFKDATLEEINRWVSRKTEGEIKKILDTLGDDTAAVLLNAMYLKAAWAQRFTQAVPGDFYVTPQTPIKTPMMHNRSEFRLHQGDGYRAVRLPFKQENLGMFIVLPDRKDGLAETSRRLDTAEQTKLLAALRSESARPLDLALPKFKIAFAADLVEAFQNVGLRLAFADAADFSGMTGGPRSVKIGNILHKGAIDVAEEGITAAAVTAVEIVPTSAIMGTVDYQPFVVDRPFLFFVADQATGAMLFEGRVVDPTKTA